MDTDERKEPFLKDSDAQGRILAKGAEAVIFFSSFITKDRIKKSYRISEIDSELRKKRTQRESKVLLKLEKECFPAPRLIDTDKESRLKMTFLDGEKISEVLEDKNYLNISEEIGKRVKELHLMDIIHGDLTTSNMILADDKIHLIDFGLSFFSKKIEDKAVDIHLLKSALESKHHRIYDKCFKRIIKVYLEDNPSGKEIIAKIKTVESRGRNKSK